LIRPIIFSDFHNSIAQRAVAKPGTADAGCFHLAEIKPDRMLSSFDVSRQLGEAAFEHSGVSTGIQAEINK
jgi:hypothetical protein